MTKIWGLLALAILIPSVSIADSPLAAAAKKERERREKNKKEGIEPVREINQEDVETNTSDNGSWNDGARSGSGSYSSGPIDRGDEQAWRSRSQAARARVDAARRRLASASLIKPYTYDSVTIDMNAVPSAQRALAAAEKALADLEEEARRSGIPAGWLR
jgi:hypothetical protein